MASLIEVRVPDIGDFKDVEIIEVAVQPGDAVAKEATLITLETEKATMDVPSTAAGIVSELKVSRGARVSKGDLIALIEADASGSTAEPDRAQGAAETPPPASASRAPADDQASAAPAASPAPAARSAPPPPPAAVVAGGEQRGAPVDEPGFARSHASPSIRRFARELGVDLARVEGSGAKGRITEQDVKAYVKRLLGAPGGPAGGSLPRVPVVDFAAFGPIERRPLTRIQKISGPRLHASWVNVPHVTQFDEADITDMEAT
jgi:pyruvate dehydrogenase E2 component (dihydrolipoamide acetyltransferase)